MVDNNEEKLDNKANETENNEDFISPDLLEEAEVYLAEEESAEAREFIRDEEIKADGKLLHYTKVVLSGILDQIFTIGLALIINTVRIPRKKRNNLLFVSELDRVLLNMNDTLTSYSKIELNKMLDDGLKFTIATMRTPAALLEALKDIRIKLPVIAMDGAILFDVKDKRYLKVYEMTHSETKRFLNLFKENNLHCFINVVIEDSVVIYYSDFKNPIEKEIYDTLRSSPYRNYIKEELPERYGAVYLMLIDETVKIEKLYLEMKKLGYIDKFKILKYSSDDFPGYSYIKIYNKKAIKENMIKYIK